jgi:AcrR family transcriptional regulator
MPPQFKFTKEEIVDAGFKIARENGWETLTTRAIAKELGASARPIYSFFGSMEELDEILVKKAVDLLYAYMIEKRTDDPWHDHGIGYVLFAMAEKHLFQGLTDGKRVDLFKKYGDVIWETLTLSLKDYPPFEGLNKEEIYQIQLTRWLFAHGLAFQANRPPKGMWTQPMVVALMQSGSDAICEGHKAQFNNGRQPIFK